MNENILRNVIQRTLHEIGVILLYALLSAMISYIFYNIFYSVNMPTTVSEIDQKQFINEVSNRMHGNMFCSFGDLKLKYLGDYKYDYKITSMTDLDNINESRLRILKFTTKNYSLYIGLGCLLVFILVRYVSVFYKWLYPKEYQ